MKTKNLICVLIVIVLVMSACKSEPRKSSNIKKKIGVVLPLTGPLASYGIDAKNGIQYAYSTLGKDTIKYSLIFEDSKAEPKSAVNAIKKLTEIDKVEFIVGDLLSNTCLAMLPTANLSQTLMISPTASSSELRNEGNYCLSIYPSEIKEGKAIAKLIEENKFNNVAIIYEKVAAAENMSKSLVSNLHKDVNFIANAAVSSNSRDFRTLITKLKQRQVETVVIITYTEVAHILLKQIYENNWKVNLLSQSALYDPAFLEKASKYSEGMLLTGSYYTQERKDSLISLFVSNFEHLHNTKPNMFAAQAYDAFLFGLEIYDFTSKNLVSEVMKTEFNGVTGRLLFDDKLLVDKDFSVFRIKEGDFVFEK